MNKKEGASCITTHLLLFYAQSPGFHKQRLCYYLKILYL